MTQMPLRYWKFKAIRLKLQTAKPYHLYLK